MTALSLISRTADVIVECDRIRSHFRRWLTEAGGIAARGLMLAALAASVVATSAVGSAFAQDGGANVKRTPAPPNAYEYFIDLKDGAHVPLKVHIRAGLNNMGIAPAGVEFPATGHHHIIIDAPLPAFDRPIPNDDNHVHLGAGQTEIDVTLSPGPHTLQLMMADRNHIPHNPPIYSQVIHVKAELPRVKSPANAGVYFITPQADKKVAGPVTVRFGLRSSMGVAPSSVNRPNTGYHNLVVDADTPDVDMPLHKDDKHLFSFPEGATETTLALPPGEHTLQLVFTSRDGLNFDPPVQSDKIKVRVEPAKEKR